MFQEGDLLSPFGGIWKVTLSVSEETFVDAFLARVDGFLPLESPVTVEETLEVLCPAECYRLLRFRWDTSGV